MTKQTCQNCSGTGELTCLGCGGSANVYKNNRFENGGNLEEKTKEWSACARCHGKGVVICSACNGKGTV